MDGDATKQPYAASPAPYDGPPDYRQVGRHGVFPDMSHDEIERLNFLALMNRHLATRVMPYVRGAWEARGEPAFRAAHGRPPPTATSCAAPCCRSLPSKAGPHCAA